MVSAPRLLAVMHVTLAPAIAAAALPPISAAELERAPQLTGTVQEIRTRSVRHPDNPRCAVQTTTLLTLAQENGTVEVEGTSISMICNDGWVGDFGVQAIKDVQVGDRLRLYTVGPPGGPLTIRRPNGLHRLSR